MGILSSRSEADGETNDVVDVLIVGGGPVGTT
jgi:hypothetical protein